MDVWEGELQAVVVASTKALLALREQQGGRRWQCISQGVVTGGRRVQRGGLGSGAGGAVARGGVEQAWAGREQAPFYTGRVGIRG